MQHQWLSYDVLSHHMMSICPIVHIQLSFVQFSLFYYVTSFVFYQKQNVRAFTIILGVTMKAVAFES